jgi:hypothetical protein
VAAAIIEEAIALPDGLLRQAQGVRAGLSNDDRWAGKEGEEQREPREEVPMFHEAAGFRTAAVHTRSDPDRFAHPLPDNFAPAP